MTDVRALPAILAGLVCVLAPGQLRADEMPRVSLFDLGMEVRSWGVRDGLPDFRISSLHQLDDGRLLIGTARGLASYDGVGIQSLEPARRELSSFYKRGTSGLYPTRSGEMLIGRLNEGLATFDGNTLQTVEGVSPGRYGIAEDAIGSRWILSGGLSYGIQVSVQRQGTLEHISSYPVFGAPDLR